MRQISVRCRFCNKPRWHLAARAALIAKHLEVRSARRQHGNEIATACVAGDIGGKRPMTASCRSSARDHVPHTLESEFA